MTRSGHANFRRLANEQRRVALESVLSEDDGATVAQIEEAPPTAKVEHLIIPVRRVTPNDIPDIVPWLFPRLSEIWVNVSDTTWASKMRAWMQMNDASFVRTDNAVGLAIAQRDDMDGLLRCSERFVLGREIPERLENNRTSDIERELLALYRHMRDWSRSKGAVRLNVLCHSDLSPSRLDVYLSNIVKRPEIFIRLAQ